MKSALARDERITRKIYLGVFYFCAFVMASVTVYALYASITEYVTTGKIIVGQVLVDTEFPVPGVAKLVTYLMVVTVVGWYCVVKLGGEKAKSFPKWLKSVLQLFVLCTAII